MWNFCKGLSVSLSELWNGPEFRCLSYEGPTPETLDFALYIDSTPIFLYFDLYLNTAYAVHYVYLTSQFLSSL